VNEEETKVNFEMGDLVRVLDKTHQEGMPFSRLGIVTGINRDNSGFHTGVYKIMFASSKGQCEMTFWHKFLEKVTP